MSLYNRFRTDTTLENQGVDLLYGTNSKGDEIIITVARAGGSNKAFQKALTNKMRPYRRQLETNTMDNATAEAIQLEVYAETVVQGWKGVEDENGEPMPFSVENCKKLFSDLPDLFADIRSQANEVSIFRADEAESVAKN